MARHRPVPAPLLLASLLAAAACSDEGPTGPSTPELAIRVVAGDAQLGSPGETLDEPLQAVVVRAASEVPVAEVRVRWEITAGEGATVSPSTSDTDSSGIASTRLTLGPGTGEYRVRASFDGLTGLPVEFTARAIVAPELTAVPTEPAQAGETITLEGSNFSPVPGENVVLFSGVRGVAVGGSETRLQVRVPSCLPTIEVDVRVRIGQLQTRSLPLRVLEGDEVLELEVGEDRTFENPDALECLRLAPSGSARYLAVARSVSTVASARYDFALAGVSGDGVVAAPAAPEPSIAGRAERVPSAGPDRPQEAWDRRLREREERLVASGVRRDGPRRAPGPTPVPDVGDRREFEVLNGDGGFERVTAVVRHVSDHGVIYEDLEAPSQGLSNADYAAFARDFDDPIFDVEAEVFGVPSDLDGNGRVIMLFTPVVNGLTEPGSDGFVGGFFYGLDLLPDREHSNGGEIFYTLVPDPGGEFGDARSKDAILNTVPAILAHELQHMIGFNQRVLERGASNTEALWLSEALAQMAEDVVGDRFLADGDTIAAARYKVGNFVRATRFLEDPSAVSLIVSSGSGTLEERGAGWLFLRWLRGQEGSNEILGGLTRTTRTGVANVTAETGTAWPVLFGDWSTALYLDDLGLPVRREVTFPDLDVRRVLGQFEGGFPLEGESVGGAVFLRSGRLWSSSARYFLVSPGAAGGLALNLAGSGGGAPSTGAMLRLTLVRLR